MDAAFYAEAVQVVNIGLAPSLVWYLITRFEKKLEENTKALNSLQGAIDKMETRSLCAPPQKIIS